jgi:chaperone modulatory protein CbpM
VTTTTLTTVSEWVLIGDSGVLSLDELAALCGAETEWIAELVDLEVLRPQGDDRATWRFGATDLGRTRRLQCLARDFDINLEAAALILDLLEEAERLRALLRRAGIAAE